MHLDRLGVIGLGAIGGSVAWQARRAGVEWVAAWTREPSDGVAAVRAGAVTHLRTSPEEVAGDADLVVLAAPPAANVQLLERLAGPLRDRGPLVTDVSSVKGIAIAAAERCGLAAHFAGSHPLCGTHRTGFDAARPDLFAGALVYVTPTSEEAPAREVAECWERVFGADVVFIDAAAHDELLAWTSHLPQATASALAAALARGAPSGVTYGTGARDTTRLAAGSPAMWAEILTANRDPLLRALDGMQDALAGLRATLEAGDLPSLTRWLAEARAFRTAMDR